MAKNRNGTPTITAPRESTMSRPAVKPAAPSGYGSPLAKPSPTPAVTHDQIAKRAYEIWVAKGRPAGKDLENWQQAERELRMTGSR